MSTPGTTPQQPTLSKPTIDRGPWPILVVLSLGFFMILLDTTIVNVAIPSIISSLHAPLDQVLWILNAYILVYAVLLITTGRLGDMFGPKKLFIGGLVLFTVASLLCAQAQSANELIFFRIIQAVGGAILTPQSLSIITSIFPPDKRGAAFGVWGGVAGLAAAAGPTLGGFLVTHFSWNAIFYVNLPIGVLVVILAYMIMPELDSHRKHRLDMVGVFLATSGLFALVFGLVEGEKFGWGRINTIGAFSIGSLQASLISIPTILVVSVILLIVFVLWEARVEEPLLPLSLFSDRNFSVANTVSAIVSFGMLGLFLPLTIFLQSVLGFTAEHAGLTLVPNSLAMIVVAPFAGRLTDRMNGKYLLAVGLVLYALGMGLVVRAVSLHSVSWDFTLPLILSGIGMGCTFAPLTTLAMRNISPRMAGAASGFLNTIRQVGGAIGTAVVGAILQNRLGIELHAQAVNNAPRLPAAARAHFISGFSHATSGGLQVGRGQSGTAGAVPHNVPATVAHQLQAVGDLAFRHAFVNAMKPSLALPIAVVLCGAVVALFMKTTVASLAQSVAHHDARQQASNIAATGE